MEVEQYMVELGCKARAASREVAASATSARNAALLAARDALDSARAELAAANTTDLERGAANGLDAPLMDRLELTQRVSIRCSKVLPRSPTYQTLWAVLAI